ncbi:MAG: hypothetical protein CFE23_06920 [Flavobacterium sp. BFFFF1]|uniref:hypothetical protein n=1 Tax=Flavobacterium sp. BFFFF1 TaxID=2015557 RepID=UPI000BCC3B48|nr:hypothetical protein [Flavobacterium sp. BFFFF1]OYU80955.1 MAG: hypothetical protein CFE23_06920 [Flavobacterium sp. BFFFF1]
MRKFFVVAAVILSGLTMLAQQIPFQIQKSEIFEDEYKESNIRFTEGDGTGGFWLVRSYKGPVFSGADGYYVEHYNENLELLKTAQIPIKHPVSEKDATVIGTFLMKNRFQIIEFFYDLKKKSYVCLANTLDISDFKITKKILFELTREEANDFGSFSLKELSSAIDRRIFPNYDEGFFVASRTKKMGFPFFDEDNAGMPSEGNNKGSGIAVLANKSRNAFSIVIDLDGMKTEAVKVFLFDADLNQKFERVLTKETNKRKYFFQNINISEDGNSIFLMSKYFSKTAKKKSEGGKYVFELTKVSADTELVTEIDPAEHFSGYLKIVVIGEKLYGMGFYSDLNDNRYKGVAFFEFDPINTTLLKSKYSPFSQQFISDKYGGQAGEELKFLLIKDVLVSNDNAIILNAEEIYRDTWPTLMGYSSSHYTNNNPNDNFTNINSDYNFDDIVSVKINRDGEMVWARNINKRQSEKGDTAFLSYTSAVYNDEVYFFINAAEKVKKLSNERIQFKQVRKNKSNLNVIRIDKNGNFDFQEILDDELNEVPFMVAKGSFTGNNCFFLGRRGKKKQLLKVTL